VGSILLPYAHCSLEIGNWLSVYDQPIGQPAQKNKEDYYVGEIHSLRLLGERPRRAEWQQAQHQSWPNRMSLREQYLFRIEPVLLGAVRIAFRRTAARRGSD
jgi:hypothetical protein